MPLCPVSAPGTSAHPAITVSSQREPSRLVAAAVPQETARDWPRLPVAVSPRDKPRDKSHGEWPCFHVACGEDSPSQPAVANWLPESHTGGGDNDKFGPGNRPYWEMEEGRVLSRYPDLLRTLSKVRDPGQGRLLFESHRRKVRKEGGMISNPMRRSEPRGISLSRQ